MAGSLPEQSGKQYPTQESFSQAVNCLLKKQQLTQADLVRKSRLSKTTVSRIIRNSNDKGSTYQPTPTIVYAISLAFDIGKCGWIYLEFLAFPERAVWADGLEASMSVDEVNSQLYDLGLPLLGNTKEN